MAFVGVTWVVYLNAQWAVVVSAADWRGSRRLGGVLALAVGVGRDSLSAGDDFAGVAGRKAVPENVGKSGQRCGIL